MLYRPDFEVEQDPPQRPTCRVFPLLLPIGLCLLIIDWWLWLRGVRDDGE